VVAVVGDNVAAPAVTANVTVAPLIGAPLVPVTFTMSGSDSDVPTSPTCPLPETRTMADGEDAFGPDGSELPQAAATAKATSDNAPRIRAACMQSPINDV
jgi:hypothetical protein